MNKRKKMSEILFERYEYLAKRYAGKIFAYEELAYEYEDLLQEFRIKIIMSIRAYGRAWGSYRRGERPRPMPIKNYLETACGNKMRDFIKYISRENYKVRIDAINYDCGIECDTEISPIRNRFVINGIDLLEGLVGKERVVFSLFLRGYPKSFLNKVYYNKAEEKNKRKAILKQGGQPIKVSDIIEQQKQYLIQNYSSELRQSVKMFASYSVSED